MVASRHGGDPLTWERAEPGPANPLAWSAPVGRLAGVRLRLHFSFVLYAVLLALRGTLGPGDAAGLHGLRTVSMALASLLVVIVLREWVRALVVRAAGGSAEEVTLWPLGALQGIDPAPGWTSIALAACVGPAVSAVQLAACGAALAAVAGDWSAAFPDPFSAAWLATPHPWWHEALWFLQWTGIQVALLALLPMLPLDGGRVAEAVIVRRRGEFDAPRVAAAFTLASAALIGVVAVVRDLATIMAVAIACAGYAAFILWRLRAGDAVAGADGGWMPPDTRAEPDPDVAAREEAAHRRAARDAEEREVDRILAKIARQGRDSLTDAERTALARATERRRGG